MVSFEYNSVPRSSEKIYMCIFTNCEETYQTKNYLDLQE